jgi:uncharacterized membrane protein
MPPPSCDLSAFPKGPALAIASVSDQDRGSRIAALDLIRGVAILAMIVYHAAFDLRAAGLIGVDVVDDLGWKIFARLIAGTFLAMVGVNLVLATRHGFRLRPWLRRLALIAGGAVAVSLVTWWTAPQTFVFFGILHQIAVASVLALLFLRLPSWLVAVAAAVVIGLPFVFAAPAFNHPALLWVGLATRTPLSVDYVPVFPWFGVVLAGIVAGRLLVAHAGDSGFARWLPGNRVAGWIIFAGRWSLLIYLIHQPILVGLVTLVSPFVGQNEDAVRSGFMNQCVPVCRTSARDEATCNAFCGCMFSGLYGSDLFTVQSVELMTPDQHRRWEGIVEQCLTVTIPDTAPVE